jgi:hypothetical protein
MMAISASAAKIRGNQLFGNSRKAAGISKTTKPIETRKIMLI